MATKKVKEVKNCPVCGGLKLVPREVGSDENKQCPECLGK